MGMELKTLVMLRHGDLPGNSFKVLNRMAHSALDRPSPDGRPDRLYFGGWEDLARAMGHAVPELDKSDDAVMKRRKKLSDYVTAAIKPLIDRNLVTLVGTPAHTGTNQRYQLHLYLTAPQESGGTSTLENRGQSTLEIGGHVPPEKQGDSPLKSRGPRKYLGGTEGLSEESNTPPPHSPHGVTRETPQQQESISPAALHTYEPTAGHVDRCQLCTNGAAHAFHRTTQAFIEQMSPAPKTRRRGDEAAERGAAS